MSAPGDLKAPFFEEAMEILAEDGYGGLKLAPVCRRLGVTTGAFYHSFKNWGDFTTQLLDRWLNERTQLFIDLVHAEPDPLGKLDVLLEAAVSLPHEAEAAIRVWASIDPDVAAIQQQVDQARHEIVFEAFAVMLPPRDAERFARTGMYLLVGAEQSQGHYDPDALRWSLDLLRSTAVEQRG